MKSIRLGLSSISYELHFGTYVICDRVMNFKCCQNYTAEGWLSPIPLIWENRFSTASVSVCDTAHCRCWYWDQQLATSLCLMYPCLTLRHESSANGCAALEWDIALLSRADQQYFSHKERNHATVCLYGICRPLITYTSAWEATFAGCWADWNSKLM